MSAAVSPSDIPASVAALARLARIRVDGGLRLAFHASERGTAAARVAEADGYRVRFPELRGHCEALILNTGGGVAGGDRVAIEIELGDAAVATVSSVAAERVYRAMGEAARMAISLRLGAGANLVFAPQETILYDGADLHRTIEADVATDARLTLADILVLGRTGSGERVRAGRFVDRWRFRRNDKLIHAEATRLDGTIDEHLAAAAVAGGRSVVATLLHVCEDAGDLLDRVRGAIAGGMEGTIAAASAFEDRIIVRALGHRSDDVRAVIARAIICVTKRPLPRSWAT